MIPPKAGSLQRPQTGAGHTVSQNGQPQIDNTELVKAMDVFKENPNATTQSAFVQLLIKSRLHVPCNVLKREEGQNNTQNIQLQFLLLKNNAGENLFGAFSDWEQIKKQQNPPKEAAALPFTEILRIADGMKNNIKGLIINPFGQGILLDVNAITRMYEDLKRAVDKAQADGKMPSPGTEPLGTAPAPDAPAAPAEEVPEVPDTPGEILYVGEPLEEPYEIIKALSRYFRSVKAVSSAYFLEIYRERQEKPDPFIVIDYKGDGSNKESVYEEIRKIYAEETDEEERPDLTIMTVGEKLAKDAVINKKPFYTRKVFGIF